MLPAYAQTNRLGGSATASLSTDMAPASSHAWVVPLAIATICFPAGARSAMYPAKASFAVTTALAFA